MAADREPIGDDHDVMIGRVQELRVLDTLVDRVRGGATSLLAMQGEPGIGKTALVEHAVSAAVAAGFVVKLGNASSTDQRSFGAVLTALGIGHLGDPPVHDERRPQTAAAPAYGRLRECIAESSRGSAPLFVASVPEIRFRMIDAIVEIIETELLTNPVLLVLEDLHWADPATFIAARSIVRRLRGYPLLMIATARPPVATTESNWAQLSLDADATMKLEGLDSGERVALAERLLHAPVGPALRSVLDATGGNPLHIVDFVSSIDGPATEVRADGSVEWTARLPPLSLFARVDAQIRGLPIEIASVIRAAAILGEGAQVEDLARLGDVPVGRMVSRVEAAIASGLLLSKGTDVGFRHDLVRTAVEESMPAVERAALHRDAAQVLIDRNGSPLAIASHLDRGAEFDPKSNALLRDWLVRAARDSLHQSPSTAFHLLDRARRMLPGTDLEWAELGAIQVEAAVNGGLVREGEQIARALIAMDLPTELAARVRLWFGGALFLLGRPAEAAEILIEAHDHVASDERALLLAYVALARVAGFHPEAEEAIQRAIGAADAAGSIDARTLAHGLLARYQAMSMRGTEALSTAILCGEIAEQDLSAHSLRHQPHWFLALAFLDADRLADARQMSAYGRRLADEHGAVWAEAVYLAIDSIFGLFAGRLDEAEVDALAGIEAAVETGASTGMAWCFGVLALSSLARTEVGAARKWVEKADAVISPTQPQTGVDLLEFARARVLVAEGRTSEALTHLRELWTLFELLRVPLCAGTIAVDLAVLAMASEERALAWSLVRTTEAWSRQDPSVRLAALRLGVRGVVHADADEMLEGVHLYRSVGRFWEAADLESLAVSALRSQGRVQELYERGLTHGDESATKLPAASAWEALSEAERRVARGVADGLANKAIAARLNLSRRTVETHISRILRKLDVTSRMHVALLVPEAE